MKKIIAVVLFSISLTVYSKGVAYMINEGGGRIVITNEKCMNKERTKTYEGMWRIYTYNAKGDTTEGCFEFENDTIHVFWPEYKQENRYPLSNFTTFEK